jgi:hypothetical protein
MSKSTGISAPSLRQAAAGGTGNFEPGSGFFHRYLFNRRACAASRCFVRFRIFLLRLDILSSL